MMQNSPFIASYSRTNFSFSILKILKIFDYVLVIVKMVGVFAALGDEVVGRIEDLLMYFG